MDVSLCWLAALYPIMNVHEFGTDDMVSLADLASDIANPMEFQPEYRDFVTGVAWPDMYLNGIVALVAE